MINDNTRSLGLTIVGVIAAFVFVFMAVKWTFPPHDTDPANAFGCFESSNAGTIEVGPNGLRLEGREGDITVPFELIWSRGYKLKINGSISLVRFEDGYRWQRDPRGWSYLMPFKGEPRIFTRHQTDPDKLDEFSAIVRDGDAQDVRFVRADPSRCAGLEAPRP